MKVNCIGQIQDGIYNCYGEYDCTMCYECKFNSEAKEKKENKFCSTEDKIKVLYEYLQGNELPEGVYCKMPKLSPDIAFSVIWFLQEIMYCLPDNIEQCRECKCLFDQDSSGFYLSEEYTLRGKPLPKKYRGHYCDNCIPDIDFKGP